MLRLLLVNSFRSSVRQKPSGLLSRKRYITPITTEIRSMANIFLFIRRVIY